MDLLALSEIRTPLAPNSVLMELMNSNPAASTEDCKKAFRLMDMWHP